MQVIVQSKTLEVTDALRQSIQRQVQKFERLGVRISKVRVFLENLAKKKNDVQSASVTYAIDIPGKKEVIVKRKAADMYQAIADVAERAMRQIRKQKEKQIATHRQLSHRRPAYF